MATKTAQAPGGTVTAAQIHAVFEQALSRVDQIAGLDNLSQLGDEEFIEFTRGVESWGRKIEALRIGCAAEANVRTHQRPADESLAGKLGCRSTIELLQRLSGASRNSLRQRIRTGRRVTPSLSLQGEVLVPKYQYVAGALGDGQLSASVADLVIQTLRYGAGADPAKLDYAERCLVETATGVSLGTGNEVGLPAHYDDMRVVCRTWAQFLNQDGSAPADDDIMPRRGFSFGPERRGLVPVRGNLVPEVAALLQSLFDAILSPRVKDTGLQELPLGDPDDASLQHRDRRTVVQKQHDALATILGAVPQDPKIPMLGGAPVTVMIQTTEEEVRHGQGGWLHGAQGRWTRIGANAVNHSACIGATQLYSQRKNGRITALGTSARIFTANQRKAILSRDKGCVIPGCTVPGNWCEIHHVIPHALGGETHTDNGVLLCYYHHRNLDQNGWKIQMEGGAPQVQAPGWLDPSRRWRPARPPTLPAQRQVLRV